MFNKAINKIAALLTAVLLCPIDAPIAVGASDGGFNDITGHWAEEDIEYLYNCGIVSGVTEDTFAPNEIVNKAQFIAMLTRALELNENRYSISFSDIATADDWFAGYFGAAVDAGIIANSMYPISPDELLTRAETAQILYGAMRYSGLDKNLPEKNVTYTDVTEENCDMESVLAVSAISLMVGTSEEEFEPESLLTRAQAATVVKKMAIAAETISEVPVLTGMAQDEAEEADGVYIFNKSGAYAQYGNVDFHYELSSFSADVYASGKGEIEIWLDSTNAITGTKLGNIKLSDTNAGYESISANIDRTSGSHTVFLRYNGTGTARLKNIAFLADSLSLDFQKSSRSIIQYKYGELVNLKYGGVITFANTDFGNGYDKIEFTMKNSSENQLFEIYLDNVKVGVAETIQSDAEGVTFTADIIKANGIKSLQIKPIMNVDGSITNIRFLNKTPKADLYLSVDKAETSLNISDADDKLEVLRTENMSDGDVIKFPAVNMSDGFNILSARVYNGVLMQGGIDIKADGKKTGSIMSMLSNDDNAYFEVRLDNENGKCIGLLKRNKIECESEYDTLSCNIYGAKGIHDLFIKAVGNVGFGICGIRLEERGWYDIPLTTLEAEDMTVNLGEVTDTSNPNSYEVHSIEAESSGKATVKILQQGGYVEFKVPEWINTATDRMAITVRHSIPDILDNRGYSVGMDGEMKVSVNGTERNLLDSFEGYNEKNTLTLTSKYSQGYTSGKGNAPNGIIGKGKPYKGFHYDDTRAVIKGNIKPGDIIRLTPQLNDEVSYCYIDMVELEVVPDAKLQPQGFLSITDCGAVANDDIDDGVAIRKAVQTVKDNPTTYRGIWIPDGTFDIREYDDPYVMRAADFSGIRVLGSGEWTSRLICHLGNWTADSGNFWVGDDAVIRDVSLTGTAISRAKVAADGTTASANAIGGRGRVFLENVWMDHWCAAVWIANPSGVYRNNRTTNTWADGLNMNRNAIDMVVTNNYAKNTGDDAFAVFSDCIYGEAMPEKITIRNNTVIAPWNACGVSIWGGQYITVTHNIVTDSALHAGMSVKTWGVDTTAIKDTVFKYNRIERSGNWNEGNQLNAAFEVTGWNPEKKREMGVERVSFENNECIDNPYLFMRISTADTSDPVNMTFRDNYIRNTGLATPQDRRLYIYNTPCVRGKIVFSGNIFDGTYDRLNESKTVQMEESFLDNYPNNWNQ